MDVISSSIKLQCPKTMLNVSAEICFCQLSLHNIVRFSLFFMLDPTTECESAAKSS